MDTGYIWDTEKYERVKKKHGVMFYEVVAAMEDPNGFEQPDETSTADERWIWVGETHDHRLLMVVYSDEDLPLYRIITAFDAEGSWIDEYHEK